MASTSAESSCRCVMSPMKMPRPYVPSTRSFSRGWTVRSCTGTVGRFAFRRVQRAAASMRYPHAEIVPDDQQVRVLAILHDDVDRRRDEVRRDRRPRLAEVGRPIQKRPEVVVAEAVLRDERRARVVRRGEHAADVAIGRTTGRGDRRGHVGPRRAVITRHLHLAVVGADPDDAGGQRRLRDRGDRAVRHVTGVEPALRRIVRSSDRG